MLKAVKSKNVPINVHKNVPINVHKNFGKIESNILEIILECPEITQANIASILKITPKTVQRGISRLKEKEIIKRVGSNKKRLLGNKSVKMDRFCFAEKCKIEPALNVGFHLKTYSRAGYRVVKKVV